MHNYTAAKGTGEVYFSEGGGGLLHAGMASCRRGVLYAICLCGYLNGKPIAPFGAIDFPTFVLRTAEDAISADRVWRRSSGEPVLVHPSRCSGPVPCRGGIQNCTLAMPISMLMHPSRCSGTAPCRGSVPHSAPAMAGRGAPVVHDMATLSMAFVVYCY